MYSREEKFKKMFNHLATVFESDAEIASWSSHGLDRRIKTFIRAFNKLKITKNKILDIGCGPGTYDRILTDLGNSVVGIDYSLPMIVKAVNKSEKKQIFYLVSDVHHLPFKNETFDICLLIGVLQHISCEKTIVSEINRVLKKNGILFLMTLNSLSIKSFYDNLRYKFKRNQDTTLLRKFNPYKIKLLLSNSGFENVRIKGVYIFPKSFQLFEDFFEKKNIFPKIDKFPFSIIFAHSFLSLSYKRR